MLVKARSVPARLALLSLALLAAFACERDMNGLLTEGLTPTPTPVSPRQVWQWTIDAADFYRGRGDRFDHGFIEDVVYTTGNAYAPWGTPLQEFPVTDEEIAVVCGHLFQTERTIIALERLVWDVFDWKQTAILGAIYQGMARDVYSITTYYRDKGST